MKQNERVCKLTSKFLSSGLRETTVESFLDTVYQNPLVIHAGIMEFLKTCKIVGIDETTVNENGKRVYTWTWQIQYASFFVRGPGRGFNVIEKHFLGKFNGSYVHDDYSSRNNVKAMIHQHCHPRIQDSLNTVLIAVIKIGHQEFKSCYRNPKKPGTYFSEMIFRRFAKAHSLTIYKRNW